MSYGISPTNTGATNFVTGVQRSITIVDENNQPVDVGAIIDFQSSPIAREIDVHPINRRGYSDFKDVYDGWKGTITVTRENGKWDALQALQELLYHTGKLQKRFTIDELTTNDDGSVNEYSYQRCVLRLEDAGSWKKESQVDMKITFRATERVQLQ